MLLYVQDPESRITYANRAGGELVGRPPEEVVGRMPDELFDAATVERWTAQNGEVLRTGRPLDVEDGWDGPHPPDPQDAGVRRRRAARSR